MIGFKLTISVFGLLGYFSIALAQDPPHGDYTQDIPGLEKGIEMVAIPGGFGLMGSPTTEKMRNEDEGPQVRVNIAPFWIGKFEMSWDIYHHFIYEDADTSLPEEVIFQSVDGVTRPTPPYLDMTLGMGKEGKPAIGMTHYNAIQFCRWLYTRTGVFYRLPTEAEWEFACRAGSETAYFFGNSAEDLSEYAWYSDNSEGQTHKIGTKKPNNWGLHDMLGNVSEWTYDQYDSGAYKAFVNGDDEHPNIPPTKLYPHVVRGGSFQDEAGKLRSASRSYSKPAWKELDPQTPKSNWWFPFMPTIGFRIVRPVSPPSAQEIEAYYNIEPIPEY